MTLLIIKEIQLYNTHTYQANEIFPMEIHTFFRKTLHDVSK